MLLFAENYILFRVFGCRRINSVEKKYFISLDKKCIKKKQRKVYKKIGCLCRRFSGYFWQYYQKARMLFENNHEFCEKRKTDLIFDVTHVKIWVKWKMNENMG